MSKVSNTSSERIPASDNYGNEDVNNFEKDMDR